MCGGKVAVGGRKGHGKVKQGRHATSGVAYYGVSRKNPKWGEHWAPHPEGLNRCLLVQCWFNNRTLLDRHTNQPWRDVPDPAVESKRMKQNQLKFTVCNADW